LTPGGSLVCYTTPANLPAVYPLLDQHLSYQSTLAVVLAGGHQQLAWLKVRNGWRPLPWYVKGKYSGGYVLDTIPGSRPDKRLHPWSQAVEEVLPLIERLCPENGVVLDPMAGAGSTLVAAKRLGRRFLGCELNPATAKLAQGNLAEVPLSKHRVG
jgi:hypothetical protein